MSSPKRSTRRATEREGTSSPASHEFDFATREEGASQFVEKPHGLLFHWINEARALHVVGQSGNHRLDASTWISRFIAVAMSCRRKRRGPGKRGHLSMRFKK